MTATFLKYFVSRFGILLACLFATGLQAGNLPKFLTLQNSNDFNQSPIELHMEERSVQNEVSNLHQSPGKYVRTGLELTAGISSLLFINYFFSLYLPRMIGSLPIPLENTGFFLGLIGFSRLIASVPGAFSSYVHQHVQNAILHTVLISFAAAVSEEVFYRFTLQDKLFSVPFKNKERGQLYRIHLLRFLRVSLTSLLFATAHPMQYFYGSFASSLFLGYFYERFKPNLWKTVWIHFFYDILSFTL